MNFPWYVVVGIVVVVWYASAANTRQNVYDNNLIMHGQTPGGPPTASSTLASAVLPVGTSAGVSVSVSTSPSTVWPFQ